MAYHGQNCYSMSNLPQCATLFPKLCEHNTTCVLWQTGAFSEPHLSTLATSPHPTPSNISNHCHRFGRGGLNKTDYQFMEGVWHSFNCMFDKPGSTELRRQLTGKYVVFIGNSIIRQLFLRLVWQIRGIEEVIEHYFHRSAVYVFNATHDFLAIGSTYTSLSQPLNGTGSFGTFTPLFVAEFHWDSGGQFFSVNNTLHIHSLVQLVVLGFPYSYKNTLPSAAIASIENVTNTIFPIPFLFVTMPIPVYLQFNHGGNLTIINHWIEHHYPYYLPLAEMAETKIFLTNIMDGIHFQCGFLKLLQKQVNAEMKMPASGDCRDRMNLNLIWMMIYYLLHQPTSYATSQQLLHTSLSLPLLEKIIPLPQQKTKKIKHTRVGKQGIPQSVLDPTISRPGNTKTTTRSTTTTINHPQSMKKKGVIRTVG